MEISLALLADAANASQEGKLNLLGIFNAIYARAFPSVHLSAQLVLSFEASNAEAGRSKKIEIEFRDADGNKRLSSAATFVVPKGHIGYPIKWNHLVQLPPLRFEKPGDYVFHVVVNGEEKRSIPLQVLIAKPMAGKGGVKT